MPMELHTVHILNVVGAPFFILLFKMSKEQLQPCLYEKKIKQLTTISGMSMKPIRICKKQPE
jgi:hypothetical protein